ncbi:MAG: SPFH domain-containing protein [Candidatus Obscuribacterales bacterium]
MLDVFPLVAASFALVLLLVLSVVFASTLKKCPPNQAMIVSGASSASEGHPYRVILGGSAVVLPLIQQVHYLGLDVRTVQIKTEAPLISADGVPLQIELSAQMKVKSDVESVARAAELMLGKSPQEVNQLLAAQVLSKLRTLVEGISAEQFRNSFDVYADTLSEDLTRKFGVECLLMSLDRVS